MAGKKLLVADDSLTIQKVIRLALSNEGYEIQAVSDGNDAIQQISLFRPDVVLIDVSLPGKTAFEVKKAINDQGDFDEVRFVLMSSAFEKVDEVQADEARFHGRLTKPFDPGHLRQVLTEVLEQVAAKRMEPTALLQRGGMVTPPPPAGPSDSEEVQDLWDKDEPGTDLIERDRAHEVASVGDPFASLAPPPLIGTGESDIKHLTESTIRMSGLDDFQWSVAETGKKTTLPPAPPTVERDALEEMQAGEPALKPFPGMSDLGGSNFSLGDASEGAPAGMPPFEPSLAGPPPSYREAPEAAMDIDDVGTPNVLPLTTKQMEDLLQRQLQDTLEKMAARILPEVAERVIKAEIHRMLREQP